DDEEREVVVAVDLRPLPELLGVLDGERMEGEDLAEEHEVVGVRAVEVEPEELALGQQLLDRLAVEGELLAALMVDHVADGRAAHASIVLRALDRWNSSAPPLRLVAIRDFDTGVTPDE